MTDAVGLAKGIIAAREDPHAVLSLAPNMPVVTYETPVPEARRNYLRLAAFVHPDRLGDRFDDATKAFQILVNCFETIANPRTRPGPPSAKRQRKEKKPAAPKEKKKRKETAKKEKKAKKAAVKDADDEDALLLGGTKKKPTVVSDSESDEYADTSSSEEEDVGSSDDDRDEDESPAARAARLLNVDDVKPNQQRSNVNCFKTIIACPKCRTPWQQDDPKQFTLMMKYGIKTHCQLCLFTYGWATALHGCPHCRRPVEYDPSNYDKQVSCEKCKKQYGYMNYPVTPQVVLEVRRKGLEEELAEKKKQEREARNANRGGNSEDELLAKVGQCMVDDRCPICRKEVRSKHKDHVKACLAKGPAAIAAPPAAAAAKKAPVRKLGTKAAAPKPAAKKAAAKPKAKKAAAKKPKAKKATKAAKKKKPVKRKKKSSDSDTESSISSSSYSDSDSSWDSDDG